MTSAARTGLLAGLFGVGWVGLFIGGVWLADVLFRNVGWWLAALLLGCVLATLLGVPVWLFERERTRP